MFEDKLKEISKRIFKNKNLKTYFVLTNKKHAREMYFLKGEKKSIGFVKPKFSSKKKKIIYFLLKKGILQLFLKRVRLSKDIGEIVLVGGQIKGFNFRKKEVYSFLRQDDKKDSFLKQKEDQKKLGEEGISPRVLDLDKKNFFSREELFLSYSGSSKRLFEKLLSFYKEEGIKKTKISNINKKVENLELKEEEKRLIQNALKKIPKNKSFLFSKVHGEFSKEQCLEKAGKIYFIDWDFREGIITEDLVNYFRGDEEYFERKEFKEILKLYPEDVQKNIKEYLILTEIYRIENNKKNKNLSLKRIENLIK